MAEFRHDPESLSDALDVLFAASDFGDDDVLLQTAARLLNAPPLAMSAEATARIETQVLDAFKNLPPPRSPFTPLPFIGGIIAVLIIAGAIFVATQSSTPAAPAPTSTLVFTPTLVDTATLLPVTSAPVVLPPLENTVDEPNFTRTSIASAVPTNTPSATTAPAVALTLITNTPDAVRLPPSNTAAPSPSAAPSLTATTPALVSVIVEGAVDSISGMIIVIDGIDISVNPDEPLLGVIQIGDSLHVEGLTTGQGQPVTAVTITFISADVSVNEDGVVWRDNGNCSNPPPAWAPAYGWHRRCDNPQPTVPGTTNGGATSAGNSGGTTAGNGNGNGNTTGNTTAGSGNGNGNTTGGATSAGNSGGTTAGNGNGNTAGGATSAGNSNGNSGGTTGNGNGNGNDNGG